MNSSGQSATVPSRHSAWCGVVRWAVAGLLVGVVTPGQAAPSGRGPIGALGRMLGQARTEAGYLAAVGVPPLRWLERPAPPPVEEALITLHSADSAAAASGDAPAHPAGGNGPAASANGPVAGTSAEPKKPAPVRPEDFLPFFERETKEPAPPAVNDDGQRFVPAYSPLPTSKAEYHLK